LPIRGEWMTVDGPRAIDIAAVCAAEIREPAFR
jgi:hypothetical protein